MPILANQPRGPAPFLHLPAPSPPALSLSLPSAGQSTTVRDLQRQTHELSPQSGLGQADAALIQH